MNSTELLDIPADLAARARAVPGLSQRLVHFLHLEIARYEERKKRYRPETLALVQRAREKAEKMKAAVFYPEFDICGPLEFLDGLRALEVIGPGWHLET